MTLSRQFVGSVIRELNEKTYQLTITYCWYFLYNYDETYIFNTIEKAKTKLLTERSNYHIQFIDSTGAEKNLLLL